MSISCSGLRAMCRRQRPISARESLSAQYAEGPAGAGRVEAVIGCLRWSVR
ncbi:hypothetical protein [Prauserella flavalba]|uniref:hypothetical protein n=1 Tax=Prauserella flavalba TaxID=1477506 RepID=UPI001FE6335E|nr:hypothetical protein [Prauserella flavalba]